MKIFEKNRKINFIDDNNVLVGFDFEQDCCEAFGWFLSKNIPTEWLADGENGINPDNYQFDTTFCKFDNENISVDGGGVVSFRLLKDNDEIYLTLVNSHNGYYSHGFDMIQGTNEIFSGSL